MPVSTTRRRPAAPIWLMGLSNAIFGLYSGFLIVTIPQMLAARGVPEAQIATVTALGLSPSFWFFFLCPMLDVRFSRRWYATGFAGLAALGLAVSIMNLGSIRLLEGLLVTGFAAASLSQAAAAGWLSQVVARERENDLSAWFIVGNIAGGGVMAIIGSEILHALSRPLAALVLGSIIFAPALIFLLIPAPGPDRRLARESFREFTGEVLSLVRRRQVLLALILFLAPSASFTLTNVLGGLGREYHTNERMVGLLGGFGAVIAGVVGSLLFPQLARRLSLRPLYLGIGIVGALFTLSLLLLPRSPATFALAMLGENVFQALALTGVTAIAFETIGQNNPLAATQFGLLNAAAAFPIAYMLVVDGRGYAWHGVTGEFLIDAGLGLVACLLLGLLLIFAGRRASVLEDRSEPNLQTPLAELGTP